MGERNTCTVCNLRWCICAERQKNKSWEPVQPIIKVGLPQCEICDLGYSGPGIYHNHDYKPVAKEKFKCPCEGIDGHTWCELCEPKPSEPIEDYEIGEPVKLTVDEWCFDIQKIKVLQAEIQAKDAKIKELESDERAGLRQKCKTLFDDLAKANERWEKLKATGDVWLVATMKDLEAQ